MAVNHCPKFQFQPLPYIYFLVKTSPPTPMINNQQSVKLHNTGTFQVSHFVTFENVISCHNIVLLQHNITMLHIYVTFCEK